MNRPVPGTIARVSLASPARGASTAGREVFIQPPSPFLERRGARVVLGVRSSHAVHCMEPLAPDADTLFAPRGVWLRGAEGPLLVADTGHHRILVWQRAPEGDGVPADLVLGQPHFSSATRQAGASEPGAATLNVPTGVAFGSGVLAVADAWNHRVLLWHGLPRCSYQPADNVLGQADFRFGSANRGFAAPRADTLSTCSGVLIHEGRLFVADTANRRVLIWNRIPTVPGAPADLVLGQRDFTTRDAPIGEAADSVAADGVRMRWPHAIAFVGGMLCVADAGCSRIMIWKAMPERNGAACDMVLGQADLAGLDHNRAREQPSAATLNMPYAVCALPDLLVVADTANSRVLAFDLGSLATGASARGLAGQNGFGERGENRWGTAMRDSVCWPYGASAVGETLALADTGNNRVLLWDRT
jgi:hypothetical protein